VHGPRLHEDGRDDPVAGVQVGQQLVEQVAPAGPVPEVVVRVDDRAIRLEDLLAPLAERSRSVRAKKTSQHAA